MSNPKPPRKKVVVTTKKSGSSSAPKTANRSAKSNTARQQRERKGKDPVEEGEWARDFHLDAEERMSGWDREQERDGRGRRHRARRCRM